MDAETLNRYRGKRVVHCSAEVYPDVLKTLQTAFPDAPRGSAPLPCFVLDMQQAEAFRVVDDRPVEVYLLRDPELA